ncbi:MULTISPECIES: hypothetical protein [Providencia]|nr:hypothetical protein [Providencia stuartii]
MLNYTSSCHMDRDIFFRKRPDDLTLVVHFSIAPDDNKLHSNITCITNRGDLPLPHYSREKKAVDFNLNKIILFSNEYFLNAIPKSSLTKTLSEANANVSSSQRKYIVPRGIDRNHQIDRMMKQEFNTYIFSVINRIINEENISLSQKKELPINYNEKKFIYYYLSKRYNLGIVINPENLVNPSINSTIKSNKLVYDEIQDLAKSNSSDNNSRMELASNCVSIIGDFLFDHYFPEIPINEIKKSAEKAIRHTLKDRKK